MSDYMSTLPEYSLALGQMPPDADGYRAQALIIMDGRTGAKILRLPYDEAAKILIAAVNDEAGDEGLEKAALHLQRKADKIRTDGTQHPIVGTMARIFEDEAAEILALRRRQPVAT